MRSQNKTGHIPTVFIPIFPELLLKILKFDCLLANSCGYIQPDWKGTIYRPKTDIFVEPFSRYKLFLVGFTGKY